MVYAILDEEKRQVYPDKTLVSWNVSVYQVDQEVAVASFFLSLKDLGHDPGVWWLSSSSGGRWWC